MHSSARVKDLNGWPEIKGNPISKVGVFPYLGKQINPDLDPDKIYNVYRPEEELSHPECINSFKLVPWIDDHIMLGSKDSGFTPAESKGIHGIIGEDVYYDDGYLKGNLKVFSDKLAQLIENGKKELSIGYRCQYDITSGVYQGERYDAIQRNIRGNHLALVDEGRAGPDVSVLDHFKTTFDSRGLVMPDENMKEKAKDEGELTLESLAEQVKNIAEMVSKLSVGKDAEEKPDDKTGAEDVEPEDFVEKAEVTDEDEEKKDDEKKKEGMDAKYRSLAQDVNELKKTGIKGLLKEIDLRNKLASDLSFHIGAFDHADKTLDEVAQYGIKKLGLKCKPGHEGSVLSGYLAGRKPNLAAVGQDSRPTTAKNSQIQKYLGGNA